MNFLKKLAGGGVQGQEVSVQEAFARQQSGWALVDVRSPGEFVALRAQGALNIPLDQVTKERVEAACPGKNLLLICHSGGRSMTALKKLSANFCREIVSVAGGTSALEREGLPVVRGQA